MLRSMGGRLDMKSQGYMTHALSLIALTGLAFAGLASGQGTINTLAGNGSTAYSGDGGPAKIASLNHPRGMAVNGTGTVYISDPDNFRIRAVDGSGRIFTVAGNGILQETGDGGLAANASVSDVMGMVVDTSGNLYFGDATNRRIRKITPGGIISSIAGVGTEGFSGDGGPATQAQLGRPMGLAFDGAGNLFVADSTNNRIRRIDVNGTITTVAGTGVPGFSGDGGLAVNASIKTPTGVAVDSLGNLYFADADNNRIRKISTTGLISTVVGTGAGGFFGDGGLAISAALNIPYDVAVDGQGNIFIADAGNNRIRKVSPSGVITTLAGTGVNSFSGDGGAGSQATLNFPWGLAVDSTGTLYIADRVNSRVRTIAGAAVPPPVQGAPTLLQGGVMNGASFSRTAAISPGGIVVLFGTDLAVSAAAAPGTPLPTLLGQTSVLFNGIAVPLYYVSPTQINAQAPFDLPLGNVSIQVRRGTSTSATQVVTAAAVAPGIFILDATANTGVILHSDFTLVTSAAPARPNETLVIYATGLGAVQAAVKSGDASPTSQSLVTPTVSMGNMSASVAYAGLAPGFVGVDQINVVVPAGIQAGGQGVQILDSGASSNTVVMPVSRQ
jgi:uncharacterized protein (TIGR03437 family)